PSCRACRQRRLVMTPLHYLMVTSANPPAELAKTILATGVAFGANTAELTGADVRRWHSSGRRIPLWASAAIVSLAIRAGWPVESAEEREWAVRGWRAAHPDSECNDLIEAL